MSDRIFRTCYYVPPDQDRPVHTPYPKGLWARVNRSGSPDGQEGFVAPDMPRGPWQKTAAGWWVADLPANPADLLRLDVPAEQCERIETDAGHELLVRRLLDPTGATAIPMRFGVRDDGSYGYVLTGADLAIINQAREYRQRIPAMLTAGEDTIVDLMRFAGVFLGQTHHLSLHEIAVAGWLSPMDALTICGAATGTLLSQLAETAADLGVELEEEA